METSKPQSNQYQFQSDISSYSISIKVDSSILTLLVENTENLPFKRFKEDFTLDQILQISKWFLLFDSLDNMANELDCLINENKFKIDEEYNTLNLFFLIQTHQIQDIHFKLKLLESENNKLIDEICKSLNNINKTLSSHGEVLNKLSLSHEFGQVFKRFTSKKSGKGILLNEDIESLIANSISMDQKVKYTLLYSANFDGKTINDFHSFCDNKGPTLLIIRADSNFVFGGYTVVSWDNSGQYKRDDKAFLFSENNKKVYLIEDPEKAKISSSKNIMFGSQDLTLKNNFMDVKTNTTRLSSYSKNNLYNVNELNQNRKKFKVMELEVYLVKIID